LIPDEAERILNEMKYETASETVIPKLKKKTATSVNTATATKLIA